MAECKLSLSECLKSCDISNTEPGWSLVADVMFCLGRQTACNLEYQSCYDEALRTWEACCRIGGPVFEGCTQILVDPGGTRGRRRFKRGSPADYWAITADTLDATTTLFGASAARAWTRAQMSDRIVLLLEIRGLAETHASASEIAPLWLAVDSAARRELAFLDAIKTAPKLARTVAKDAALIRNVLTGFQTIAADRLSKSHDLPQVTAKFERLERRIRASDHHVDYRPAVTGSVRNVDFRRLARGTSRDVRGRIERLVAVHQIADENVERWIKSLGV